MPASSRAGRARRVDQRVLAGAARADDQHEAAGADRRSRTRVDDPGACSQFMPRAAPRTTRCAPPEPLAATRTRIRSARLPAAISPRSVRPTASAGVLVTVRTAAGRSMLGTALRQFAAPPSAGSTARSRTTGCRARRPRRDRRSATLPECEPPRTRFGAPISTRDAAVVQRRRRPRAVVGNSAIATPSAIDCVDMLQRRVVVAGQRRSPCACASVDQRAAVAARHRPSW